MKYNEGSHIRKQTSIIFPCQCRFYFSSELYKIKTKKNMRNCCCTFNHSALKNHDLADVCSVEGFVQAYTTTGPSALMKTCSTIISQCTLISKHYTAVFSYEFLQSHLCFTGRTEPQAVKEGNPHTFVCAIWKRVRKTGAGGRTCGLYSTL